MTATAPIKVFILRDKDLQFISAEGIPSEYAEVQIKVGDDVSTSKYYEGEAKDVMDDINAKTPYIASIETIHIDIPNRA